MSSILRSRILRVVGASALSSAALGACGGRLHTEDDLPDAGGRTSGTGLGPAGTSSGSSGIGGASNPSGSGATTGIGGAGGSSTASGSSGMSSTSGATGSAATTTGVGGAPGKGGSTGIGGARDAGIGGKTGIGGVGGATDAGRFKYLCYTRDQLTKMCANDYACSDAGADTDGGPECPYRLTAPSCQLLDGPPTTSTGDNCCYRVNGTVDPSCNRDR